jgi:threonyl-tRNA synthetase
MKILTLHCDYIKFKPLKKAIKDAEELKEKGEIVVKEPLVVLMAVEKGDSEKEVNEMIKAVETTAKEVKAKKIVLYPYAHLSSNLENPSAAVKLMIEAEEKLKKKLNVVRAPFGYYKEFELKCKGHPLSELSKEFRHADIEEKGEAVNPERLLKELSHSHLDTSKLKEHDHRILGQKLDLFSFNEVAPGMVFWHYKGKIIYNELLRLWRELHREAGYQEISTPQIMDSKLWKISGHWDKYKENNFVTKYEDRPFLVKPMNCPGGMLVYKSSTKSYRDFPMRVGEIGIVHRTELSGVLAGLFRVIQFTQDDAHIFCANEKQVEEEIIAVVELIEKMYKVFGLKFDQIELSTRPEKRIGSDEMWDMAENLLTKVLKKMKLPYKINKGDGAFYGPKIDFHIKDSLGRQWQLSTIQLDFAMPERFNLEYVDKNNEKKKPITLHRVIYGSLERFIGIMLEHLNGALPTWLSPVQVRVLSFTDRNDKAVEKIVEELKEKMPELRVETDIRNTTVNEKVRDAEIMKVPYIIVIGDKEEKAKTLAVRRRGEKPEFGVKIEKLVNELVDRIKNRK